MEALERAWKHQEERLVDAKVHIALTRNDTNSQKKKERKSASSILRKSLSSLGGSLRNSLSGQKKPVSTSVLENYMTVDDKGRLSFQAEFMGQGENLAEIDGFESIFAVLTHHARSVFLVDETGPLELQPELGRGEYVVSIACCSSQVAMLTSHGRIFVGSRETPALNVQLPAGEPVVQVVSSRSVFVFLSVYGRVFSLGASKSGELGLGPKTKEAMSPMQIEGGLRNVPVMEVAAGGNHFLARSFSGTVFGWGGNNAGQLGLKKASVPWAVPISMDHAKSIACGENFSAVLENDGTLTVLGNQNKQHVPCEAFEGEKLSSILSVKNQIMGQSKSGTLFMVSPNTLRVVKDYEVDAMPDRAVVKAHGVDGFVFFVHVEGKEHGNWCKLEEIVSGTKFTTESLAELLRERENPSVAGQIREFLRKLASDPMVLSQAFPVEEQGSDAFAVDFEGAREMLGRALKAVASKEDGNSGSGFRQDLGDLVSITVSEMKSRMKKVLCMDEARGMLVLVLSPLRLLASEACLEVLSALRELPKGILAKVNKFLTHQVDMGTFEFGLVEPVVGVISKSMFDAHLDSHLELAEWVFNLNEQRRYDERVDYRAFFVDSIKNWDRAKLLGSFEPLFGMMKPPISSKKFPFLFPTEKKLEIFQLHKAHVVVSRHGNPPMTYAMRIHRKSLLKDSLRLLSKATSEQLSRPLVIVFEGEEGMDAGGVRKEFFDTLSYQLFHPSLGLFETRPETNTMWFKPNSGESAALILRLVGQLLGLAVLNNCILDVAFPVPFYEIFMNKDEAKLTLEDLRRLDPSLAHGLQELDSYKEDDIEDVFALTFEVGSSGVELKPNGSEIPVTQENKAEYIQLMVEYYLVESVRVGREAILDGFQSVVDSSFSALQLFRAEELELLVAGNPAVDLDLLKANTLYEGGFHAAHPTVVNFWDIVSSWDPERVKKLIRFATGAPRIPAGSLASFKFTIQRAGVDSEQLPGASTCFNTLLLPDYRSKDKLERKLLQAIENSKGFFLK